MRLFLRSLLVLTLILAAVPLVQASSPVNAPDAPMDDEIILLTSDGRISVRDPYTAPDIRPVVWDSPGNGFTNVVTGDFNGDTASEVVGLRGTEAIVFSPVVLPGSSDLSTTFTASPGQIWTQAVTGDLDGDGRDELVLVQTTSEPNLAIRMLTFQWEQGTGWAEMTNNGYGAPWQAIATGDVDGDGREEFVAVRNSGGTHQIVIFRLNNGAWQQLFAQSYGFPWITVAVGNTNGDAGNREEIVVTRSGVAANLASMLVFRYTGSSSDLQTMESTVFNPPFERLALGDVNSSGIDTIYMLRPGITNGDIRVALHNKYYGPGQVATFNELANQDRFRTIHTGDLDADSRAELVVMSAGDYLIYNNPADNVNFTQFFGNYSSTTNFAIANLDGPGIPVGPVLAVNPASITWSVQAGQNTSQQVAISNTGTGALNWTASVTEGGSWLSVSPSSGTAPSNMQVSANTASLAPGAYTGNVRVAGVGSVFNSPVDIPVMLTVTAPPLPSLSVTPASIVWSVQAGQSTSQQVQISNIGAGTLSWTAAVTAGGSWLSVSPGSGTAPSNMQVSANAVGLAPGAYTGNVRVTGVGNVLNSPVDIPVSLTVTAPQFSVRPPNVSWYYRPGTNPPQRIVEVVGASINWHAGAVPTSMVPQIEAAIANGTPMRIDNGLLLIGDQRGPDDVPIVDWIDINPSVGTATQSGTVVQLSLVTSQVEYGFSTAAVVFVADQIASPPAVVVRASVLRSLADQSDLTFMPSVE